MSFARTVHQREVEEKREGGETLHALFMVTPVAMLYLLEHDKKGCAEVLSSGSITLRRIATESKNEAIQKQFLQVAKRVAEFSIQIAEWAKVKQPDALALPYVEYGRVLVDLQEFQSAAKALKKAVAEFQSHAPAEHNRDIVLHYFQTLAVVCEMRADRNESTIKRAEDAIQSFDQTKIDDKDARNKIVWLSGLYLQMARGLHNSTHEGKARGYYQLADKLVKKYESAYDLSLRRSDIEKIRELFV